MAEAEARGRIHQEVRTDRPGDKVLEARLTHTAHPRDEGTVYVEWEQQADVHGLATH